MFGRLHLVVYPVLSSDHRSVNEADRCSACTLTNEPSRGTRRTRRSLARHSIQMFRLIRLLVAPADAPQKCRFFLLQLYPFFSLIRDDDRRDAISSCGPRIRRLVKATLRIVTTAFFTPLTSSANHSPFTLRIAIRRS